MSLQPRKSSDSTIKVEMIGRERHAPVCSLSTQTAETGGSLELAGCQPSSRFRERLPQGTRGSGGAEHLMSSGVHTHEGGEGGEVEREREIKLT